MNLKDTLDSVDRVHKLLEQVEIELATIDRPSINRVHAQLVSLRACLNDSAREIELDCWSTR